MSKYTIYVNNIPMVKNISHAAAINQRDMFRRAGLPVKMVRVSTNKTSPRNIRRTRKRKRKAARKSRKR